MKTCIHCGKELPDDINFCPYCTGTQTEPTVSRPLPHPRRQKVLLIVAFACAALALLVFLLAGRPRPKTYDNGEALALYTDADGSYHVFLTWTYESGEKDHPVATNNLRIAETESSAHPTILFVYDIERKETVQDAFYEKVASARITAVPHDGAQPVEVTVPLPNHDDFPAALMAADVTYSADSGVNDIVWTLEMKNGDRIILTQTLSVTPLRTQVYTAKDVPMETIEDLQALLDRIQEEDQDASVLVYLPAVSFEGALRITGRSLELIGTAEGDRQTSFKGSMIVSAGMPQITYFRNLVIDGDGGVGIYATERLILSDCTIRNCSIGAYAQEGSWIGIHRCTFENNDIGFQFDSHESFMADPDYDGNRFLNNGTAILLLNVPGPLLLYFQNTEFTGNGADIENPNNFPVDTREAAFS